MDARDLPEVKLNWEEVKRTLNEHFEKKDAELLRGLLGLEGPLLSPKELKKISGLRGKHHDEKMKELQRKLFNRLKEKELRDLLRE